MGKFNRIISAVIISCFAVSNTVAFADGYGANYTEVNKSTASVRIYGKPGIGHTGERVTLLLAGTNADGGIDYGNVGYIDETAVDYSGEFLFKFYVKNMDRYNAYLRVTGSGADNITDSFVKITDIGQLYKITSTVEINNNVADVKVAVDNLFNLYDDDCTAIIASYDKNNQLCGTVSFNSRRMTKDSFVNSFRANIPADAAYCKLFIWNDFKSTTPLSGEKKIVNPSAGYSLSENFESYNINKTLTTDGDDEYTSIYSILDKSGNDTYYGGLKTNRILNGAYPGEAEKLEKADKERYDAVYGNGVYDGNAAANTMMVFDYKGDPVQGNLGGVWYGYLNFANPYVTPSMSNPLTVTDDGGNQVMNFLVRQDSEDGSVFGRYDLKGLKGKIVTISQRVNFSTDSDQTVFGINMTKGAPNVRERYTQMSYAQSIVTSPLSKNEYRMREYVYENVITDKSFYYTDSLILFKNGGIVLPVLDNYRLWNYNRGQWYTVNIYLDLRENAKIRYEIVNENAEEKIDSGYVDYPGGNKLDFSADDNYGVQYVHRADSTQSESGTAYSRVRLDDFSVTVTN